MRRTQIYLTEEQRRALRHIAAERDSNVSDLVRQAVDRLIASEGIDWGARFDTFRQGIEAGPEITEEDFEAADAEVQSARKMRRAATA
jgi:Arc/MetJ-type ribon-helix-helix transcriptional regulator